jgi:hypothetical protein
VAGGLRILNNEKLQDINVKVRLPGNITGTLESRNSHKILFRMSDSERPPEHLVVAGRIILKDITEKRLEVLVSIHMEQNSGAFLRTQFLKRW